MSHSNRVGEFSRQAVDDIARMHYGRTQSWISTIATESLQDEGSHIEAPFRVAIEAVIQINLLEVDEVSAVGLHVKPQHPIGKYSADCLVYYGFWDGPLNGEKLIVVECDGHDFHERTKQQAAHDKARDRFMHKAGYQVFRHTGSELYKNPYDAAFEVVSAACRNDELVGPDAGFANA